jgi:GT2 family glycosyltransferase
MTLGTFRPTKVVDVELSHHLETLEHLDGYDAVQALVRLHGEPLGFVRLPVKDGRCLASALARSILDDLSGQIISHLVRDGLALSPRPEGLRIADLFRVPHAAYRGTLPSVTVAVCTRDRPAELANCLESLVKLDYPSLQLLVIDNAPTTDATERLIRERYPNVGYIRESRPGLNWARNRAIDEAQGEIIAYTDDDAVVDPGWVTALASIFAEQAEVMAVTGLVVPFELETEAQELFELHGGFGRGFEQRWVRVDEARGQTFRKHGTGLFGTGANMSYRRSLFERIGNFDPALDVGTVTNGGGDLEMFFRVLKEGYTLVYEPSAIVRHCHRRENRLLRTQITNNGIGLSSYFVRSALAYPRERAAFALFWLSWLWWRYLSGLLRSRSIRESSLLIREMMGCLKGLVRYPKSRRNAAAIASNFGDRRPAMVTSESREPRAATSQKASAVRTVELSKPLLPLTDVMDYPKVRVFVFWKERPLGVADITNCYQPVAVSRLREAIARCVSLQSIEPDRRVNVKKMTAEMEIALAKFLMPSEESAPLRPSPPRTERKASQTFPDGSLSPDVAVSVIVATRDRPDDLRNCLRSLMAQVSVRRLEIVVVDNNPASGLTPPVLREFPHAVIVNEPRQGLAYARNAGFCAGTGDILATTDDDVIAPPDWVEKLVRPFANPEVMIVTGNVLPLELESDAQNLFEYYGGLGRGFEQREFGSSWFRSSKYNAVPTWTLGCTANAAFHASIFVNPDIALMDEALGPGMPSGVGEDTYLFYKTLKAGYRVVYEAGAYVWHRHRREVSALRRQLYGYSKGHVAYHLTTLFSDRDLRGLIQVLYWLPRYHLYRIRSCLSRASPYPLSLIMLEIGGNLIGPLALWQSRRRVQREGRSGPYVPVAQRRTSRLEEATFSAQGAE